MTEDTSPNEPSGQVPDNGDFIECPVGRWYYKRMGLMFFMLSAMGCWFLYDAAIKYPKKKDIWDQYTAVTGYDLKLVPDMSAVADLPSSGQHLVVVGKGANGHHFRVFDRAGNPIVDVNESDDSVRKRPLETLTALLGSKWGQPELAADEEQEVLGAIARVVNVNLAGAQKDSARLEEWRQLANERGWELEPEEYTDSKIATQWQFTVGMFVAALVVAGIFLLNKGKKLKADAEAFYTPAGKRVAFADVFKVDRRKWDHKGLAYAMYREGGEGSASKATIDDLKFVGADKVLSRLVNNFKGDLIDRLPDSDDEEDGDPDRTGQESENEDITPGDEKSTSADQEAR